MYTQLPHFDKGCRPRTLDSLKDKGVIGGYSDMKRLWRKNKHLNHVVKLRQILALGYWLIWRGICQPWVMLRPIWDYCQIDNWGPPPQTVSREVSRGGMLGCKSNDFWTSYGGNILKAKCAVRLKVSMVLSGECCYCLALSCAFLEKLQECMSNITWLKLASYTSQ